MPRARRFIQPQAVYHLIARFVAGEWFIRTNEERGQYLRLLGLGLAGSDWRCLAFAIMSNHIHLGMLAGTDPFAGWIRDVHTPFAEWINRRHKRIGAVFTRGPKSHRVRPDGVARVIGYIHRNPVRAGLVSRPSDSDWTSHGAYLGLAERPTWLDVAKGLELSAFADAEQMDTWVRATAVDRADAQAALLDTPRGPGRPRTGIGV